ncbi:flagellin N-terminal helical domain-containing protein [Velocimicrobium porci]|uniref:Flagellin N-terminal domain-containing protein n=1 Tax=Velocimicrobium porci TaxID=2606634 RepID=A0A6L5XYU9_9FIRM|nr:hypothetical protein [Velocimicrobium porci]MSS63874.1 hypothetical protein [Velocimicrobium porci]
MRVTNRMMTTNMLSNINRNKQNMDTLGNQYSTQQKIQRPSEDPVVAVRSLKYRTQLSETTQYVEKNIPDAFAWMDVTEGAMKEINSMITSINTYCNQGSTGTLEIKDRNSIIETLTQYRDHVYNLANADYAGRYVFTGFRTDTSLLFSEATNGTADKTYTTYTIKEELTFNDISNTTYVKGGVTYAANKTANQYASEAATTGKCQKLALSYGKLDTNGVKTVTLTDKAGNSIKITTNAADNADGFVLKKKSMTAADKYEAGANEIVYIEETGELIFGENVSAKALDYQKISVEYDKTKFEKGDIRPEHYFECKTTYHDNTDPANPTTKVTNYTNPAVQKIEYEVNFSQKLTVNTLAKDAFPTSIRTKMDEIIRAVNEVFDMDDKISDANKLLEGETDKAKIAALTEYKEQLTNEKTLKEKILQEAFGSALTTTAKAQEQVNVAVSNHGSRYLRLQMTESRLSTQKIDFTEMLKTNDCVELEDAIINYKSAEIIYNASLNCASTVVKNSLLDFL